MTHRLMLLSGFSTIALTGVLSLSGCGVDSDQVEVAASASPAMIPAMSGSAEGEGGVDVAAAASDAVVYASALAIAEAHVLAARDAYVAGRREDAAGMFAHPVSEVLADMQAAFVARGVEPFHELFIDASSAALAGESVEKVNLRTERIVIALRKAMEKAPPDGKSTAMIAAGVSADQIDRAVDMYRQAAKTGEYGAYLDGYGYFKAAESAFRRGKPAIKAELPECARAIEAAIRTLAVAYPNAGRAPSNQLDVAELSAASSRVMLTLRH